MRIEAGTTMAADEELIKQLEDAGEAFDQECQELKLDKDPIPTRTTPEGRVFLGFFGTQHVGEQGAA
jgi:hypothetical protein